MIHGWANIIEPVECSLDGLMVFDSMAGPAFGTRLRQTDGWQEIQLFRVARADGTMHVTFALSGVGQALLDDVSVRVLPTPRQVASVDTEKLDR